MEDITPRFSAVHKDMSDGVGWCPGAGEGNRTLVVSLGSFCSAIELHPHFNPLTALSGHFHNGFTAGPTAQPLPPPRARVNPQIWRAASGRAAGLSRRTGGRSRSEEHTSELQSLMRISYAVFCLKKKIINTHIHCRFWFTTQQLLLIARVSVECCI